MDEIVPSASMQDMLDQLVRAAVAQIERRGRFADFGAIRTADGKLAMVHVVESPVKSKERPADWSGHDVAETIFSIGETEELLAAGMMYDGELVATKSTAMAGRLEEFLALRCRW